MSGADRPGDGVVDLPRAGQVHGAGEAGRGTLAFDGRFRLAFVLFGGMLALQSSPTLDATKIAYLVGTALCLAAALAALWGARRSLAVGRGAPWIAASAALAMLIAVSFLVARGNGTSITDWLRDVAAYGLFAAVPVLALDGQASTSRKVVVGMLVVAGLLGGFSWAIEWLGRRQILELPFSRLVFPSGQLPGLLYLFALAMALTASRRLVAWVMVAGLILSLFLVTGTRSSLLLLIGPLAMAALAGWARMRTSIWTIVSHGAVAATLVVAFQIALALPVALRPGPTTGEPGSSGSAAPSVPSVLGDRLGSIPGALQNPASDQSLRERVAQYRAAWALFISSPILGVGPGHSIDWVDSSGQPRTGFTADTPLVLPAKFGVVGILVLSGAAVAYGLTVRTALRRDRQSVVTLTLVGYGAWTVVSLPLGFPVEDKGASLALMLLLALAFIEGGRVQQR
jgi:hypothetical protein